MGFQRGWHVKSEVVRLGCSLLPLDRVQEGKGPSREQGIGL